MIKIASYKIIATEKEEKFAAEIFCEEIGRRVSLADSENDFFEIEFIADKSMADKDSYSIRINDNRITFSAFGIRGLIYAVGMFLRKSEFRNNAIHLICDFSGDYSPFMQIRGHQLGWRTTANSYEAWTAEEYFQYIKELMFFGCNIFEHIAINDNSDMNDLMKYPSPKEFIKACNEKVRELDVDISYWYPHGDKSIEESVAERENFFSEISDAQVFFPPGSDPGDFPAPESIKRTIEIAKAIRKHNPDIKVFPSAQSPDGFGKWGEEFIAEMNKLPEEIDGIITGPNCAMPLHDLRRRLPMKYPVRLYPDITHNVKCEYPVHFDREDWHYALAATLGREAINPRPTEYRTIHRLTRQYITGSVSYSEGINDDVNKFVWSDMDYFPDVKLTDSLSDYARLFFPGADTKKVVNGILGLEKNWEGDPAENPHIETTLGFFNELKKENPELLDNARFLLCLFRAECDMLVKSRRVTELELISDAVYYLKKMQIDKAREVLSTPFSDEYNSLREDISAHGKKLFEKVGLQLDVKNYLANGWERGATLDTIDNPVTDRLYLLGRLGYAETLTDEEKSGFIARLLSMRKTNRDEYYFSFAENSFTELGIPQTPYFYMDFQGDNPDKNNGTMPMSMTKVFDHYSFRMKTGGLTGSNYKLMLNIKPRYRDEVTDFTIKINGNILYQGKQYGGTRDERFEKEISAPGFEMHVYEIPDEFIDNGCIELEIAEPKIGIMISEMFIKQ